MREQGIYIPMIFMPQVTVGQPLLLQIETHIDDIPTVYEAIPPITFERSDFTRCDHGGISVADLPVRVKQILP
jgi:hypothetical protein